MSDSTFEITEPLNSVEITQNAKRDLAFKIKAYGATLEGAINDAQKAYTEMRLFVEGENRKAAER